MKKTQIFLLFVTIILTVGCADTGNPTVAPGNSVVQSTTPPTSTTPPLHENLTVVREQTEVPTVITGSPQTPVPEESGTPKSLVTPTIPQEANVQIQCPDMVENQVSYEGMNGMVILESRVVLDNRYTPDTRFLNLGTGETIPMTVARERQGGFVVSPNRQLVAFTRAYFDDQGVFIRDELVIATADGKQQAAASWEDGWTGIVDWLDNERLLINISGLNHEEATARKAATLLVLNPFTGERTILRPDFPDIYNIRPIPSWGDWSITVYDPQLTRVVYLTLTQKGEYAYALSDLQTGEVLTQFISYLIEPPRWSPDSSQFVVTAPVSSQDGSELFLVIRNGLIERLTNLNVYRKAYFSGYSWSPNGRNLAAWLTPGPFADSKVAELVLIDTMSKQVMDLCVKVKYGGEGYGGGGPLPPIWSPDGNQLVVMDWYEKDHRRVFLVDRVQNFITPIAEDMEPVGWMRAP
jgi:hypothetical protein